MDPTSQAKLFKTYLETGAYTVNEIRGEMDMPSVKDGDKNYISTNLAELGSEKLKGGTGAAAQQRPTEPSGAAGMTGGTQGGDNGTNDEGEKGGEG